MSEQSLKQCVAVVLLGLVLALPAVAQENDPMRPPQARQAATPSPQPSWDLSYILIGESRRLAVVNGELLRVGDRVSGARVDRIEADRVLLSRGEQRMTLTLRAGLDIQRRESN